MGGACKVSVFLLVPMERVPEVSYLIAQMCNRKERRW